MSCSPTAGVVCGLNVKRSTCLAITQPIFSVGVHGSAVFDRLPESIPGAEASSDPVIRIWLPSFRG